MRIQLYHPELGAIWSDSYPEDKCYYDVIKVIRGCLTGTHASLEFMIEGNGAIIPAEIVKQSVITIINETETKE